LDRDEPGQATCRT